MARPDKLDEVTERAGVAPTGATGDLAEAVGRLEAVAHTDDLTGLHNRRGWIESVRRELAAGTEGALLLCDIDHFKGVAGRLGGDELGVWVREGEEAGRREAAAIVEDIANSLPVELVTGEQPVAITVGMAMTPPGGAEVMELVEAADRELYAAKPGDRRRG